MCFQWSLRKYGKSQSIIYTYKFLEIFSISYEKYRTPQIIELIRKINTLFGRMTWNIGQLIIYLSTHRFSSSTNTNI